MLRTLFVCALMTFGCGGSSKPTTSTTTSAPDRVLVLTDDKGLGAGGNDPVAYTTDKVEPGVAEHTSQHGGATYQFASADAKQKFDAEPARYAPRYGGYCAYAASQNRLSESDPTVFMNHEGQLLLFTNQDFLELFKKDPATHKQQADANWPGLVTKHGK
jgi:YHS domain-containing protein